MYYLLFGFCYFISLAPFWILYRVSDLAFFVMYYLVGYRRKIVMDNLRNAFPAKPEEELQQISRRFYRNFCDTWVEMLKVLSISKRQLAKRVTCDYSMMYELFKTGIPVQAFAGHFMNWEYANISVVLNQPYPFLGIYMPVNSKALSRLLYRLRSRFGTILLKAGNVKADMEGWEGKQYVLGIAADQSPSNSMEAFWMEFMNQPSGFIKKPWLKIKTLEHAAVYMTMARTRRGYYHFTLQKMAEDIRLVTAEQLVLRYRDLLEKDINDYPDNYLWTHRRWKIRWKEDFQPLWIDTVPAPLSA